MSDCEYITIDEADGDAVDVDEVVVLDNDGHRSEKRPRHRSSSRSSWNRESGPSTPIMTVHFSSRHVQQRLHRRVSALLSSLLHQEGGQARCQIEGDKLMVFCSDREEQPRSERHSETVAMMSDGRPQYDLSISGVVGVGAPQEGVLASRGSCFNCDGDHMLADCDKPRDIKRIAKNRRLHAARAAPQSARYHEEQEGRWGGLQPGQLSKKLRRALGLSRHQLPVHVLRMRQLGYPPGWLHAAERNRDARLRVLTAPGPRVRPRTEQRDRRYDADRLVAFPGFNGDWDGSEEPGQLGYSERQSLEEMTRQLCDSSEQQESGSCSSSPGLEVEAVSDSGGEEEGEVIADMSLRQLHERRQLLLASLSEPKQEEEASIDGPAPLAQSTPRPARQGAGDSLHVHLGTPVSLRTGAASASLPDVAKWAEGITQHLPFENLPGATGSWERIRSLVDKVRARAKDLNVDETKSANMSSSSFKSTRNGSISAREDTGSAARSGCTGGDEVCDVEELDCVESDMVEKRVEEANSERKQVSHTNTSPFQSDNEASCTTETAVCRSSENIPTSTHHVTQIDTASSAGDKTAIETVDISGDECCLAAGKASESTEKVRDGTEVPDTVDNVEVLTVD